MFQKRLLFLLPFLISAFAFIGPSHKDQELKAELIGTWNFVELRDREGNKIDTIWHDISEFNKRTWEIPKGPLLKYNADGTYSKQFTPENIDTGTWHYDKKKKAIIQRLIYKKPYNFAARYLIEKGHAKQDEDGNYYEVITDKVLKLTDDKLTILEREGRQRRFKKRK